MKILAIESSCDETAAAVVEINAETPKVISNIVASQIDIHTVYGGVVPEVAARAHMENIIPVIEGALKAAKTPLAKIDRIAVTAGPGLIGSLVVGVETAKALAVATSKPIFPINHLEGHIYASFASQITNWGEPEFPLVALIVSGGNSMLVHMEGHFEYEVVGQTWDDAAGEAFDKGAKLMGLGYPGGPLISKLAKDGNPTEYSFPLIDLTEKPKRNEDGFMEKPEPSLDFSFSGLKTALLNHTKRIGTLTDKNKKDLAAGYEKAIVDTLVQNSARAIKKYQPKTFILSGGVAANIRLRESLQKNISENSPSTEFVVPPVELCGDNAAMIGAVCAFRTDNAAKSDFAADPSLKL